jgi:hypothetical protein
MACRLAQPPLAHPDASESRSRRLNHWLNQSLRLGKWVMKASLL